MADRIVILKEANQGILDQFINANFICENSLVQCDIECAEFSIFAQELIYTLKKAQSYLKYTAEFLKMDTTHRTRLVDILAPYFDSNLTIAESTDWAGISEPEELSDNGRALATPERRKIIGEWLIATLKHIQNLEQTSMKFAK